MFDSAPFRFVSRDRNTRPIPHLQHRRPRHSHSRTSIAIEGPSIGSCRCQLTPQARAPSIKLTLALARRCPAYPRTAGAKRAGSKRKRQVPAKHLHPSTTSSNIPSPLPQCDQAKPACSRCARLNLACIGCGQQRFKFKDETPNLKAADKQLSRRTPAASRAALARAAFDPSRALTNPTTITASAFISVLEITDPSYDLFCYGTFMNEIPQQLGRHEALDASAEALASCFSCVHTGTVSTLSISKYVRALNSVQKCLQNPKTAYSGETLCAIYLIMLVQVSRDHSARRGPTITDHFSRAGSAKTTTPFPNTDRQWLICLASSSTVTCTSRKMRLCSSH